MFEAYKVAVKLSLINNVSSGLVGLASQFQSLNKHIGTAQGSVTALERQLLSLKRLGLVGGAMAGAGAFGLSLFKGPLEEAKQFQLEVAKFEALGLGDKMNRDAVEFAKGMKTYGTSLTENMVLFRDAQTVFRDSDNLHHAELVTPMLAKMKFANETLYGSERAGNMEGKFMDMLRVIEMRRGLNSPDEFGKQANMIQQVLTTSGGRVDATQYLNLIKTGGVAAKSLSNEALYYQLEPLIQEMGGNRVGTGLMSAYNNLILGRTTVQSAKELNSLGLLDSKHVEYNKIGMIKRILPGGLKGGDMMADSPVDFLEKVLLPAFKTKGITEEKDVLREIGLIFSNRTASQLFSTMFLQMGQIRKGEQMSAGAMNIDQADAKARETAAGKEIELHKKWKDVLNALGTTVLPIAIKAVEGLTVVVRGIVNFAREWPRLTQWLVVGFGVLSGIVAAGGTLALATAGFKALGLALAMGGAAGGVGGMLGGVAGGLGLMTKAAGVFMAAYAGWQIGGFLNDKVINGGMEKLTGRKGETLGGWIYEMTHKDSNDRAGSRFVSGKSNQPVQVKTQVNMDGRKVAEVVTTHQTREASRPMPGATSVDYRMYPPQVANR
jgi:hypothetical protein